MHMPYNEWAVPHTHTKQNDALLNQCVVSLNEHRTIKCATMPLFHANAEPRQWQMSSQWRHPTAEIETSRANAEPLVSGKCPLSGAIRR